MSSRALLVALVVAAVTARAQDGSGVPPEWADYAAPGVVAEVAFGLAGRCSWDYPVPLALALENQLEGDLEGTWEVVRLIGDRESERLVSVPVFCARGARLHRRVATYLIPGAYVVRVVANGTTLWRRWIDLDLQGAAGLDREAIHVLVVQPRDARGHVTLARSGAKGTTPTTPVVRSGSNDPAAPGERAILSWRVEPAVLPLDAISYMPYHAVVFAPADVPPVLDAPSAEALAQLVWLGGQVVVPRSAAGLRQAIAQAMPMPLRDVPGASPSEAVDATPVGLGRLVTVDDALFEQPAGRAALGRLVEAHGRARLPRWRDGYYYSASELTPNATASMLQIAGLFVLYALVAGPGIAMFLRRRARRTIAIVLAVVVLAFCVLAALVGPFLGSSPGDYRWSSVTELGPRGSVQWAKVWVYSAGARTHSIELAPEHTLTWELAPRLNSRLGYYSYSRSFSYDGPGRQVARPAPDRGTIAIDVAPWGERELISACPGPSWPALRVKVSVEGTNLRAVVTNTTPAFLRNARVVVGGWSYRNSKWNSGWQGTRHTIALGVIAPGARSTGVTLTSNDEGWGYVHGGAYGSFEYPGPDTRDRVQGLFVAEVDASPVVTPITRSFDLDPLRTGHLVLQQLEAAELPLPTELLESEDEVVGSGS